MKEALRHFITKTNMLNFLLVQTILTLERAKSMMATSSNAGLYKRLNKNERLRVQPESHLQKAQLPAKRKKQLEV